MAEGRTRLSQQVVDTGYWTEANQVTLIPDRPWSSRPPLGARPNRLQHIRQAVEADVIPRLFMARDRQPGRPAGIAVVDSEVLGLVKILLGHDDVATVSAHVATVQAKGVSVEDIYLHLFQPAARHVGELWFDDLCTFVDVTLAVGMLQKLLRTLGPIFHRDGRTADGARQALIVPLPGDQHTFGLSMVAEFLRRAAWSVWSTPISSREALRETVRKIRFTVVGFSASHEDRLDELSAVIRQVRRESCNRAIRVMVGGPLFVEHPDYVARVGADAMGVDATHALALAEGFLAGAP